MKCLDKENIIYCDNHILVVDKPAEIATQPDLEILAKAWIRKKYNKPGNVFLEPIHRLDKPVRGLVLFARTSKALSRLQAMMRAREIKKTYIALVEGSLPKKEGTLKHHLSHGSHRAHIDDDGKGAVLHYRVLEKKEKTTLLEIELETGRYHQIRAQLATIGCPVVGDKKYGSHMPYKCGIALTHVKLEFTHPVTHEGIVVTTPSKFKG